MSVSEVSRNALSGSLAALTFLFAVTGCLNRPGYRQLPTAAQPCPPWVQFPIKVHSNEDSPYLGCVNRVNLDSMLERSDDLSRGRSLGPASGERESRAIDAYEAGRTAEPKPSGVAAPTILLPAAASGDTP